MHTCPIPMSGPSGSEKSSQMCPSVSPLSPVYFTDCFINAQLVSSDRMQFCSHSYLFYLSILFTRSASGCFGGFELLVHPLYRWSPQSIIDACSTVTNSNQIGMFNSSKAACWSFFLDSVILDFSILLMWFHDICSLAVAIPSNSYQMDMLTSNTEMTSFQSMCSSLKCLLSGSSFSLLFFLLHYVQFLPAYWCLVHDFAILFLILAYSCVYAQLSTPICRTVFYQISGSMLLWFWAISS